MLLCYAQRAMSFCRCEAAMRRFALRRRHKILLACYDAGTRRASRFPASVYALYRMNTVVRLCRSSYARYLKNSWLPRNQQRSAAILLPCRHGVTKCRRRCYSAQIVPRRRRLLNTATLASRTAEFSRGHAKEATHKIERSRCCAPQARAYTRNGNCRLAAAAEECRRSSYGSCACREQGYRTQR